MDSEIAADLAIQSSVLDSQRETEAISNNNDKGHAFVAAALPHSIVGKTKSDILMSNPETNNPPHVVDNPTPLPTRQDGETSAPHREAHDIETGQNTHNTSPEERHEEALVSPFQAVAHIALPEDSKPSLGGHHHVNNQSDPVSAVTLPSPSAVNPITGRNSGRPHHLLRHTLPPEASGINAVHHFGVTTVVEALRCVQAMSQRLLQQTFERVYNVKSSSNNNNWLRKKLVEALVPFDGRAPAAAHINREIRDILEALALKTGSSTTASKKRSFKSWNTGGDVPLKKIVNGVGSNNGTGPDMVSAQDVMHHSPGNPTNPNPAARPPSSKQRKASVVRPSPIDDGHFHVYEQQSFEPEGAAPTFQQHQEPHGTMNTNINAIVPSEFVDADGAEEFTAAGRKKRRAAAGVAAATAAVLRDPVLEELEKEDLKRAHSNENFDKRWGTGLIQHQQQSSNQGRHQARPHQHRYEPRSDTAAEMNHHHDPHQAVTTALQTLTDLVSIAVRQGKVAPNAALVDIGTIASRIAPPHQQLPPHQQQQQYVDASIAMQYNPQDILNSFSGSFRSRVPQQQQPPHQQQQQGSVLARLLAAMASQDLRHQLQQHLYRQQHQQQQQEFVDIQAVAPQWNINAMGVNRDEMHSASAAEILRQALETQGVRLDSGTMNDNNAYNDNYMYTNRGPPKISIAPPPAAVVPGWHNAVTVDPVNANNNNNIDNNNNINAMNNNRGAQRTITTPAPAPAAAPPITTTANATTAVTAVDGISSSVPPPPTHRLPAGLGPTSTMGVPHVPSRPQSMEQPNMLAGSNYPVDPLIMHLLRQTRIAQEQHLAGKSKQEEDGAAEEEHQQ